jgi:tetratricopeptide (TPR) repeat protein
MIAMRPFTFYAILLPFATSLGLADSAHAQSPDPSPSQQSSEQSGAFTTQRQRLDTLFTDLKREGDPEAARSISDRIRREWQDSGSASINLLVQWADKAMTEDKNASALDFLDETIRLSPNYVEGWNRRATLHFKMGSYRKSMSDINRVLALEPRHFGAIAGMAAIFTATGRDELALQAWERFLEVYPSERRAQKEMGDLAEKLAGQRT